MIRSNIKLSGPLNFVIQGSHIVDDITDPTPQKTRAKLNRLKICDSRLDGFLDIRYCELNGGLKISGSRLNQTLRATNTIMGPIVVDKFQCHDTIDFTETVWNESSQLANLQANGHLLLTQAKIETLFRLQSAIIHGIFDARHASFSSTPDLSNSTFNQSVRLHQVIWPEARSEPILNLSNVLCEGTIKISDPMDRQGRRIENVIINLLGATVRTIRMDKSVMQSSLDWAKRHSMNNPRSVVAIALLFEANLARELDFDAADNFYRQAKDIEGGLHNRISGWI